MKLRGISPLGVKIQKFLFMKKLPYIKSFFPVVLNTKSFARETDSTSTSETD